jgi:2-polyprenyl-6-methoxyphenol hydroxylase-like FAD-dependent oxidoreductase
MVLSVRVAVVGGGVGGLCLAHGLVRAGLAVTVYERDVSAEVRGQGYRLHIDANGAAALRECLPDRLFERYARIAYRPATDTPRVTVLTKALRTLREVPLPAADPSIATGAVDRQALRDILVDGLGERLRFGWEFTRFEPGPEVTLHFAGERSAVADVLVGADGVGSRVRRQYLPGAEVRDTGDRCVYGRTPLAAAPLPAAASHGFVAVVDVLHSRGMAIGVLRPAAGGGYVMWALTAPARAFRGDVFALDGPALTGEATRLIRRWHPDLRALVAGCDPARSAAVAIRIAQPVRPWSSTNVTLLGDAIHAMSPSGGSGANTALRDAALLSRHLAGGTPVPSAIDAYESAMREYGFAAVARSGSGGPVAWRRS